MKKLTFLTVLGAALITTRVFAQSSDTITVQHQAAINTTKIYLDIMVNIASNSLNYGDQNGAASAYKKSAKGIQAGLSFQAGITPAFALVTEFYYIRKGGDLKAGNPITGSESGIRLNTLELPVLARYNFGVFHINAGPSIAYNLSGKQELNGQSSGLSFGSATNQFRRFDAGVQFGGGVGFPLKQRRIELDVRYGYGLSNVAASSDIYNRALMVSIRFSKAWKKNPLAKN